MSRSDFSDSIDTAPDLDRSPYGHNFITDPAEDTPPTEPTTRDLWWALVMIFTVELLALAAASGIITSYRSAFDPAWMPPGWALVMYLFVVRFAQLACVRHYACSRYDQPFRQAFALHPVSTTQLVSSVVLAAIMAGVVRALRSASHASQGPLTPFYELLAHPSFEYGLAIASLILPFVEEVLFRGFAFPILKHRYGFVSALVIVTASFTLVHFTQISYDMVALNAILIVGFVLNLQRHFVNSLVPCIVTHWIYNALIMVIALAQTSGSPSPLSEWTPPFHAEEPTAWEIRNDITLDAARRTSDPKETERVHFEQFRLVATQQSELRTAFFVQMVLKNDQGKQLSDWIKVEYDRTASGWRYRSVEKTVHIYAKPAPPRARTHRLR